jgi:hypothetical protein
LSADLLQQRGFFVQEAMSSVVGQATSALPLAIAASRSCRRVIGN